MKTSPQEQPNFAALVARFAERDITFRPVDGSKRDRDSVRLLIQAVYVDELHVHEQADTDVYDQAADVLLAFHRNEPIATARLIDYERVLALSSESAVPEQGGRRLLPMELHFSLEDYLVGAGRIGEAGRVIVLPQYRQKGVPLGFLAALGFFAKHRRIDTIFNLTNYDPKQNLERMYVKSGWQRLAEPFYVERYHTESLPMRLRTEEITPAFHAAFEQMVAQGVTILTNPALLKQDFEEGTVLGKEGEKTPDGGEKRGFPCFQRRQPNAA